MSSSAPSLPYVAGRTQRQDNPSAQSGSSANERSPFTELHDIPLHGLGATTPPANARRGPAGSNGFDVLQLSDPAATSSPTQLPPAFPDGYKFNSGLSHPRRPRNVREFAQMCNDQEGESARLQALREQILAERRATAAAAQAAETQLRLRASQRGGPGSSIHAAAAADGSTTDVDMLPANRHADTASADALTLLPPFHAAAQSPHPGLPTEASAVHADTSWTQLPPGDGDRARQAERRRAHATRKARGGTGSGRRAHNKGKQRKKRKKPKRRVAGPSAIALQQHHHQTALQERAARMGERQWRQPRDKRKAAPHQHSKNRLVRGGLSSVALALSVVKTGMLWPPCCFVGGDPWYA